MVCFYCKCPGHNRNNCQFRKMLLDLIPDLQGAIQDKLHIVKKEWDIKRCRDRLGFQLYHTISLYSQSFRSYGRNPEFPYRNIRSIGEINAIGFENLTQWQRGSLCRYITEKCPDKPNVPHKNMKMGKVYWNPKHRDHFGR